MVDTTQQQATAIQAQIDADKSKIAAAGQAGITDPNQQIPASVLSSVPTAPTSTAQPGAGIDDQSYLGVLNNLNTGLQQNNGLVSQKNLIQKQLFDQPLSASELAQLPPDVRAIVQGGNQDQMKLQLQVINDSLQGRNASVASSIQFLTTGYENAQSQYQSSMTSILNYSRYLGAKPSDVLKAAYPQIYNNMTPQQLQAFTALDNAVTGTPTSGVNGYDLSSYNSADPNYSDTISGIVGSMGNITDSSSAQQYISQVSPVSPITGDMVTQAAQQYGVDPATMLALFQQESSMDTAGAAVSNNNPGNIKFANQPGAIQGSAATDGGYFAKFNTLQDGVNAEAQWLANHPSESSSVQSWVNNINDGKATLANVPANLKTKVSQALDTATQSSSSQPSNLNDWISSLPVAQQNDLKSQASASGKYNQEVLGNVYGIATGMQPPVITGSMGAFSSYIKAGLTAVGFNMVKATNEWTATSKYIASANSQSQVRLKQAIGSVQQGIGQLKSDADKWNAGGFAPLNSANMTAALNGVYGQDAQSIAADFQQQATIIQDELGQTFMGGNSPTDKALSMAGKVFDTSWSATTLSSSLDQLDTNLGFRMNAINTVNVGGLGSDSTNPYAPPSSESSGGTTPPPAGSVINYQGKNYTVDAQGNLTPQ